VAKNQKLGHALMSGNELIKFVKYILNNSFLNSIINYCAKHKFGMWGIVKMVGVVSIYFYNY